MGFNVVVFSGYYYKAIYGYFGIEEVAIPRCPRLTAPFEKSQVRINGKCLLLYSTTTIF